MNAEELEGKWYLTPKTLENLGFDISEIKLLDDFPIRDLVEEEVAKLKLFIESHLLIKDGTFKIYFANPKKNKLKVIRKGEISNFCEDKKGRPCLCFVAEDGEEGKFKLKKKGVLKDSTSPFEFQREKPL